MRPLLLLFLLSSLTAATIPFQDRPVPEDLLLSPLYRNGTERPTTGRVFTIQHWSFLQTTVAGHPAIALAGERFIVPCPTNGRLLLPGIGQITVTDWSTLTYTVDDLPIDQAVASDCALLTRLRIRCGLVPIFIDPDLCLACADHLEYRRVNRATGLALHQSDPSKPGYTQRGAQAGMGSSLIPSPRSMAQAIDKISRSAYHAMDLWHPQNLRCGVGFASHLAALYPQQAMLPAHLNTSITLQYPQKGATNIPTTFAQEIPSPVPPGVRGGTPIMLSADTFQPLTRVVDADGTSRLARPQAIKELIVCPTKSGRLGRPVQGYMSSPFKPAAPECLPHNSRLLLFVPRDPLQSRTTYHVRYVFVDDRVVEWSFTTGK